MGRSSTRLYTLLGVAPDADEVTLRRAYKLLTTNLAPAANPDDATAPVRVKQVRRAYEVLADPEQRALYDEFGDRSLAAGFDAAAARRADERALREQAARAKAALAHPTAVPLDAVPGATPAPRHWKIEVSIPAGIARKGGRRKFEIQRPVTCPGCAGSGRSEKDCRACGGARVVASRHTETCAPCRGVGLTAEWARCRPCAGSGITRKRDCRRCAGAGIVVKRVDCTVCRGYGVKVLRGESPCQACAQSGLVACKRCAGRRTVPRAVRLVLAVPRGASEGVLYRYAGAGFTSEGDVASDLLVHFVVAVRAVRRRRRRRY